MQSMQNYHSDNDVIRQAVAVAAMDPSISMYQLTVKEVVMIADVISDSFKKEGINVYRTVEKKRKNRFYGYYSVFLQLEQ